MEPMDLLQEGVLSCIVFVLDLVFRIGVNVGLVLQKEER
jgi:hypothetical protein